MPPAAAAAGDGELDHALLLLGDDVGGSGGGGGGGGAKSPPAPGAEAVSPWRWWVLATYTLMAANQGLTWSVPGALEPTLQAVYGMDQDTVQLLLNYGPIFYCVAMLPVMWSIDRHGIRPMTLAGIALVLAANAMRCFANDASALSIGIVHVSFILNAIAGPAAMAIPSKLAEDWFPAHERTTATAISALGNQSESSTVRAADARFRPAPTDPRPRSPRPLHAPQPACCCSTCSCRRCARRRRPRTSSS